MEHHGKIFHLAIPCSDLEAARAFYADGLGCRLGRRLADRITFDFFGHQVVCHLDPEKIDPDPEIYPRHFGMTFRERTDFERILSQARAARLDFFQEPFVRFESQPDEHRAFFLRDPSNNLVEFKHYANPDMAY